MYTGDDFHHVDLIVGDERGYSDALLGAFAAFPEMAADALRRLDTGDAKRRALRSRCHTSVKPQDIRKHHLVLQD